MPFLCGGHPRPGVTRALIPALERAGASIVEVGIPFSDPIADGSVIAAAMHEALAAGATPISIFDEVAGARAECTIGIVAMVSISILQRASTPERFVANAQGAGFDGLIVPDCPPEEAGSLVRACADAGITLSFLIAPSTSPKRAELIMRASTGFVYLLARTGITGEQAGAPDIEGRVTRLRQMTDLPIAVGFGISTAEHVKAVVQHADAAIVGSALVRRIGQAAMDGADPVAAGTEFIRHLATGLGTIGTGTAANGIEGVVPGGVER